MSIGIIGGSGLDNPNILQESKDLDVNTKYGRPSSPLKIGKIKGVDVVLISRHGREHTIPPSQVNYRANIQALKDAGCTHILATTAVGSLREEIGRGHLVILDQFIDFTKNRKASFYESFEPHNPVHTPMAQPFNEELRKLLIKTAEELDLPYHKKGTAITIEGPRFSTKSESKMFRLFGADVINMSVATEASLANELNVPYAAIAMSTDYDSWKESEEPVTWEEILRIFGKNVDKVTNLLVNTIPKIKQPKMDNRKYILPNWQEIYDLAKNISDNVKKSNFYPDTIVAISRGGLVPGRLFGDFLHIKNILTIKADHWGITATKDGEAKISHSLNVDLTGKKVLLVDDITDTGKSMELAIDHVNKLNPKELKTATLYHIKGSKYTPDFYSKEIEWVWVIFPWNYREDMVNIIKGINEKEEKNIRELKEHLKELSINVQEEELKEIVEHIEYLNKNSESK